ncbi:hypothetical protein SAMN05216431_105123 [Ligilactobacillus sp. WC1T17]|uniref:Uncharacterized protein n=1 Tax=Ligilactobacillus ruminis TaxID=1623 RepID=A0ABY1ABB8_9LACO|nr:hypothetical protein SAMN05216431_105123 [Ligilactobacillus ruminis]
MKFAKIWLNVLTLLFWALFVMFVVSNMTKWAIGYFVIAVLTSALDVKLNVPNFSLVYVQHIFMKTSKD